MITILLLDLKKSILLIMFLTVLISIFFIRCYPNEEQKQIPTSTTNIQTGNVFEEEADSLINIE